MTNYNKFGVGRVMSAKLPNGKTVYRAEQLLLMLGEQITFVNCVPDDDHFLFQLLTPIPQDVLITKYNGIVPVHLRGPVARCTCGSTAIVFVNGPYINQACCQHYAAFGRHLTSEKVVDGQLILSKESAKWLYDGSNFDETLFAKRNF